MSDPDLYHSDPMRRHAAQQREDAKARNISTAGSARTNKRASKKNSPPIESFFSSNNSKPNNEIFKDLDKDLEQFCETLGTIIVILPYRAIRFWLNKLDGIPNHSPKNNKKAGVLTAAFLGTMTAMGIGNIAYNNYMNEKYPAISIAFNNNRGTAYTAFNKSMKEAEKQATRQCLNKTWGIFTCYSTKSFEGGQKMCVSYGRVGSRVIARKTIGERPSPRLGFRTVCNFD